MTEFKAGAAGPNRVAVPDATEAEIAAANEVGDYKQTIQLVETMLVGNVDLIGILD